MNEIIDRINRIAAFLLALAATCGCAQEPRPCREIKFSALPQGTMLYADHVNLSSNGEPFAKDDAYSLSCLKVEFVDAADGTAVQRNVPALMKTFGGADVKSVADWRVGKRASCVSRMGTVWQEGFGRNFHACARRFAAGWLGSLSSP